MSFQCPQCKAVSHNPNDEQHQYCGACKNFWDRCPLCCKELTAEHKETLKDGRLVASCFPNYVRQVEDRDYFCPDCFNATRAKEREK